MNYFMRVVSDLNKIKFSDVTVTIPSTRMSGEMNTSLGNGLVNFIIINYISEVLHKTDVTLFVEGDDSIYKTLAKITAQDFTDCGFTCELSTVETISEASFCGLIFDTETYTVIADPIKYILKTPWMMRRWMRASDKAQFGILKCKALSLLWQFPGCPIIQAYAYYLYRNTYKYSVPKSYLDYVKNSYGSDHAEFDFITDVDDHIRTCTPTRPVAVSTRLLMARVYKISIEEQLYLEDLFMNKPDFGPFYDPVIYSFTTPVQQHFYEHHVIETDLKVLNFTNYDPPLSSVPKAKQQLKDLLLDKCTNSVKHIFLNLVS